MNESAIQNKLRLAAAANGQILWRNNSGAYIDRRGALVRYGLCNSSKSINKTLKSSDLIGITQIEIKPHHVGRTMGIFTAIEVKPSGWDYQSQMSKVTAQINYINLVKSSGGIGGFCTDENDMVKALIEFINKPC